MTEKDYQPGDIVLHPCGAVGYVVNANGNEEDGHSIKASVEWFRPWQGREFHLRCAWWSPEELRIIDSLPFILARATNSHHMNDASNNFVYGKRFA